MICDSTTCVRHEATSRLFEKGLNPMEVAAITGPLQMLTRYCHPRPEDLAQQAGVGFASDYGV